MDIEATITEKVRRFEDIKNQIAEIGRKIGGLTEQQRALYNQGLELKGGIETLLAIKEADAKALAASKTAQLTLPEGVKPVMPDAPVAPVSEDAVKAAVAEMAKEGAPAQPVVLEVK